MLDAMFELPSKNEAAELKITMNYAKEKFNNSKISNKLKVA